MVHTFAGAFGKVLPKTIDKKFKHAYGRFWFMAIMNALRDENVQVSGILFIMDFSDFPIRALNIFSPSESSDIMKYQVSRPRSWCHAELLHANIRHQAL